VARLGRHKSPHFRDVWPSIQIDARWFEAMAIRKLDLLQKHCGNYQYKIGVSPWASVR
jgi:hypothetical protein